MQLHTKSSSYIRAQRGAMLVISMILIILLSALGLATMSGSITSLRISHNYSDYMSSEIRATSMAAYADRILGTYPDGVYPGPATCTSTGTCNGINSGFPHNGRPTLVWTSGLGSASMNGSSESDAWWTTNGFDYEDSFGVPGNDRVIVQQIGTGNTNTPYQHTYRIVGYGSDANGKDKATYEMFHVWNGYPPDQGDGTCSGGCNYAECCSSSNTCSTTQTDCEGGSATYTPPGWLCSAYFVTGLGYSSTTCDNPVAIVGDAFENLKPTLVAIQDYYKANSAFPSTATVNGVSVPDGTWVDVSWGNIKGVLYAVNGNRAEFGISLTGLSVISGYIEPTSMNLTPTNGHSYVMYAIEDQGDDVIKTVCGQLDPGSSLETIPQAYLPSACSCSDVDTFFTSGTGC